MKSLFFIIVLSASCLFIISCDNATNPTSSNSTEINQEWLLGNWIEVKFEYYYMDGNELEQGTDIYNEASTKSYVRFTQKNAYWYWIFDPDVQIDTMSYSIEAKLFSSDDYDFKIERKNDTLIIKDTFTGGHEYDFYVKYDDPLPFL